MVRGGVVVLEVIVVEDNSSVAVVEVVGTGAVLVVAVDEVVVEIVDVFLLAVLVVLEIVVVLGDVVKVVVGALELEI